MVSVVTVATSISLASAWIALPFGAELLFHFLDDWCQRTTTLQTPGGSVATFLGRLVFPHFEPASGGKMMTGSREYWQTVKAVRSTKGTTRG